MEGVSIGRSGDAPGDQVDDIGKSSIVVPS